MAATEISRQLRALLTSPSDAPSLTAFLSTVDEFVADSSESTTALQDLEHNLEEVYNKVIDHSVHSQVKIFLSVLYRLRPILPPLSIISTWFDLVLRPALREPKLPVEAVNHAKELIVSALSPVHRIRDAVSEDPDKSKKKEKVKDFRRRLMDLYLLDAHNESSGDDVLEWAELDDAQKERKACWKANLEDVLVKVGLQRPQDLLTELFYCFAAPSSRLQLLILLNAYTSHTGFAAHAGVLAAHPLMQSLINCLILDNSSTECTVGITVLTKLLPTFAVKACEDLKRLLPWLLFVLARIVCWETRPVDTLPALTLQDTLGRDSDMLIEPTIEDPRDQPELDSIARLQIRPDVEWERLEQTFIGAASTAPPRQQYFAFLYYLFPCNTVRFMRRPAAYLNQHAIESPYTLSWEDVLDEDKIRSRSESLLRGHVLHPLLVWRDADEELSKPDFWAQYDVPRIVSECAMLDVRSASAGLRERVLSSTSTTFFGGQDQQLPEHTDPPVTLSSSADSSPSYVLGNVPSLQQPHSNKLRISLQEMITTSIALKSGLDYELVDSFSVPGWPMTLVDQHSRARSPSRKSISSISLRSPTPESTVVTDNAGDGVPSHVASAIAALQREVLMLRSELNFELWMASENVKHIGRLYQDRVVSRNVEVERQGLHNKLREYKSEIFRLQKDLKDQKEQALGVRNQYNNYNKRLQDKIKDFRQEKSSWQVEATAMRAAHQELKASFAAQGKLLSDANHKVFELETRIKEGKHKVDRLHDYERQIEQLIALQRLWETDVVKLGEQTETLKAYGSAHKKMQLRLQTLEQVQGQLEDRDRAHRQEIASLEAKLSISQKQLAVSRKSVSRGDLASYRGEVSRISEVNKKLREANAELVEESVELKAMVELLKAQVSGRQGVVSDPRSSPFMGPTLSI